MSLRRIEPIPYDGEKALAFGKLPDFTWVAPSDLYVDDAYQRDLSSRSIGLIRRTLQGFTWNRLKPPIVVREDGKLHIIDGQHTAIVAATLGIAMIPVMIVEAPALDERARSFVGHNRDRVVVSPFDIYHALVAGGDPDAADVANVCKRAGVRIRMLSQSSAVEIGDTMAIGKVQQLVKRCGVMKARMALQALVLAKRAPISAPEIQAAQAIIMGNSPPRIEVLGAAIRVDGPGGLLKAHVKAREDKLPVWRALQARWERRLATASHEAA